MNEKLIDEYISEVTKDMSSRQRNEVARELRTHILDSADALAAERKTTVDDFIVREVINRMGPSGKVAALYPTPRTFLEMKGLREAIMGLGGLAFACLLVAGILWLVAPETLDVFPIQIVFSIAGALILAILVITCIFAAMYIYESIIMVPYEARLKRLEKSLEELGSPLKVVLAIFGTLIGLAIINIFWAQIPMISGFDENAHLVRLLSYDFASFLPWYNLLGALTIAVNLLYLGMARSKWVPALMESVLNIPQAMLALWVLQAFPFNTAELSTTVQAGIKVFIAFIIVAMLIDTAVKLYKTARLFIHSRYERGNIA
jgi:hypothetical protein